MQNKIKILINSSRQVFLDCALENGGIAAANSTKKYYSKEANNYFYVWPRDAAYIGLASQVLGMPKIQENFFDWILERAEGLDKTGLLLQNYHPNGLQYKNKFQPDQNGTVLFAIGEYLKNNPKQSKKYKKLVNILADGLCAVWNGESFDLPTNDLWEERLTFLDLKDNFTYSLSSCVGGLLAANNIAPNRKYKETALSMKKIIVKAAKEQGYFSRAIGKINDERVDASFLGLVWPFHIVSSKDPLFQKTFELIEKKIVKKYGVYRYEHDEYDGWMYEERHRKKGAGFWPLLNFWMSIVSNKIGDEKKALKYYRKALNSLESEYIPEQIFDNKLQISVSPLAWSHAMFVLASKELKLLK